MKLNPITSRAVLGMAIALLAVPAQSHPAHAGCNVIPPAVTTFRGTLGHTDRPFAMPGDWVTIERDPVCDGPPVFTEAPSHYLVSVVFIPPSGGPRHLEVMATDCTPFIGASCPAATVGCLTVNAGPSIELATVGIGNAIRFRFPDTDGQFMDVNDDLTFSGPATLVVTRADEPLPCELATSPCAGQNGLLACVDELFADNGTCDATSGQTFSHFTALPPPNNYADLCTDPSPDPCTGLAEDARFTVDAAGNILLPMDWRGVRVARDAVPVARLLRSATTVEAFPGRGVPIRIPDLTSLGSYSPEGIKLPPLFDPQQDPSVASAATFFGSTDAEATVLRVARHARVSKQCVGGPNVDLPCTASSQCTPGICATPTCVGGINSGTACTTDRDCSGGECGPGLFDFSTRLLASVGPVVVQRGACAGGGNPGTPCMDDSSCLAGGHCESFSAKALDPVPLEGLNQSAEINAFVMEEAISSPPVDLNGDGDKVDHVIKLFNRSSGLNDSIGAGGSEGRAITRILQAPFSFPAVALSGDLVAYLEPEANQANVDQNGDGERFDTIVKVFRLGVGELTNPAAPVAIDAAPLVNGRSIAVSDRRVFYRRPEAAAARWATVVASVTYDNVVVDFDYIDSGAISADGHYVAFTSFRKFIVPDDDSGISDAFVRDVVGATVERVSLDSDGVAGNASTGGRISISNDGRFVAFSSFADNLVSGDGNGLRDVFVHDRDTGVTERVSISSSHVQGDGPSALLSMSDDGRFVSFTSDATNLVPGDGNGLRDVFVHDRDSHTTERVSVSSAGTEGDASSGGPSDTAFGAGAAVGGVSADGRFVLFLSDATNLAAGDTNSASDIFLRDRVTQTTELVSVSSAGTPGNAASYDPAMSADGRVVIFTSGANNLVPGDTNSISDVFARDRATGATTRVSVFPDGTQIGGFGFVRGASGAGVSADGRFVSFSSDNGLLPDAGPDFNVYVQDRLTNLLRVVPSPFGRIFGGVSRDGQHALLIDDPPGGGAGPIYESGPIPSAVCGNSVTDPNEDCDPPGSTTCPGGLQCAPNCECVDLTQDGEINDTVLEVLDASGMTPVVSTLCAAADVAAAGGKAVFLRPETAAGPPGGSCPSGPLNGDADTDDLVVHCWDGSGPPQNLGRGATAVATAGDWLAALVSEAADGKKYNGDGDLTDAVAQVHPVCGGAWINTGQAADAIAMAGTTVAFTTPEVGQGKNLNGDGDTADRVLQVFDTQTRKLTNVGQAAEDFVVGDQRLVAFRTREASQGQGSLNDDGANNDNDTLDDVLQVYDAAAGAVLNSHQAVTPCKLEACDPHLPYRVLNDTVRFLTLEADQGEDLNGDGDLGDLVVQVLNVRQACHNGSPVGACHTLAAISAGVCTDDGTACASDDACGVGGTCFTPPFGCITTLGGCCDTDPLDGVNPCGMGGGCGGGAFCQPVLGLPGQGTCALQGDPCLSDADCGGGGICNASDQNFQRLLAPVNSLNAGDVFTASGRCIEDFPSSTCGTNSDCDTSQFCRDGSCHRAHGVCTDDASCPPDSACSQELTRAAVDDADLDELPDLFDNCPQVTNIMQEDADDDGVGDACESALIGGDTILVKDKGGDPAKRKIVVISKDPAIVSPPPASGADPTGVGAELRLYNPGTTEAVAFVLPALHWKGLGKPAGIKGYKYTDKDLVDGPCKKVILKPGKLLKVICQGDQIEFSLDEPQQGSLAVRFVTGSNSVATSHCLLFGGTVGADKAATAGKTGRFKAKHAPAALTCPVP